MQRSERKLRVYLEPEVRAELEALCRAQCAPARKVRRARILLLADEHRPEGSRPDREIAELVGLCERQVVRIRQQFVREGVKPTLNRRPRSRPGTQPKLDGAAEARLIALCCSTPPAGRQRWTLRLLADELGRLQIVSSVCPETVRRCLKKTDFSPGGRSGFASRKRTTRVS